MKRHSRKMTSSDSWHQSRISKNGPRTCSLTRTSRRCSTKSVAILVFKKRTSFLFQKSSSDDTNLNGKLAIPRDGNGPEYARVTKRLRDKDGLPIGTANNNPILQKRMKGRVPRWAQSITCSERYCRDHVCASRR
jgi:hypothetical protein